MSICEWERTTFERRRQLEKFKRVKKRIRKRGPPGYGGSSLFDGERGGGEDERIRNER